MTTLKTKDALALRQALYALDGQEKEVPVQGQPQQTKLVKKPFKFAGKVRLKIARNLNALADVADTSDLKRNALNDAHKARMATLQQKAKDNIPQDQIAKEQGEIIADYQKQFGALMDQTANVPLHPFTEDELNLDANDIPNQALAEVLRWLVDVPSV